MTNLVIGNVSTDEMPSNLEFKDSEQISGPKATIDVGDKDCNEKNSDTLDQTSFEFAYHQIIAENGIKQCSSTNSPGRCSGNVPIYQEQDQEPCQKFLHEPAFDSLKQEPRKMLQITASQGGDVRSKVEKNLSITKQQQKKASRLSKRKVKKDALVWGDSSSWDINLDKMSNLYTNIFYKDGLIIISIRSEKFPELIQKIDSEDAKNFPKCLGDKFLGFLATIERIFLPKDSLSSWRIWNSVFVSEKRKEYNAKESRQLMIELNNLDEKLFTCHKWVSLLLRFLSDFDPKMFRDEKKCNLDTPSKRISYQIISRMMKFAGRVLEDIIGLSKSHTELNIVEFRIKKANKDLVKFGFRTKSVEFDKKFAGMLSKVLKPPESCNEEMMLEDFMISPECFERGTLPNFNQEVDHSIGFSESNVRMARSDEQSEERLEPLPVKITNKTVERSRDILENFGVIPLYNSNFIDIGIESKSFEDAISPLELQISRLNSENEDDLNLKGKSNLSMEGNDEQYRDFWEFTQEPLPLDAGSADTRRFENLAFVDNIFEMRIPGIFNDPLDNLIKESDPSSQECFKRK